LSELGENEKASDKDKYFITLSQLFLTYLNLTRRSSF